MYKQCVVKGGAGAPIPLFELVQSPQLGCEETAIGMSFKTVPKISRALRRDEGSGS